MYLRCVMINKTLSIYLHVTHTDVLVCVLCQLWSPRLSYSHTPSDSHSRCCASFLTTVSICQMSRHINSWTVNQLNSLPMMLMWLS